MLLHTLFIKALDFLNTPVLLKSKKTNEILCYNKESQSLYLNKNTTKNCTFTITKIQNNFAIMINNQYVAPDLLFRKVYLANYVPANLWSLEYKKFARFFVKDKGIKYCLSSFIDKKSQVGLRLCSENDFWVVLKKMHNQVGLSINRTFDLKKALEKLSKSDIIKKGKDELLKLTNNWNSSDSSDDSKKKKKKKKEKKEKKKKKNDSDSKKDTEEDEKVNTQEDIKDGSKDDIEDNVKEDIKDESNDDNKQDSKEDIKDDVKDDIAEKAEEDSENENYTTNQYDLQSINQDESQLNQQDSSLTFSAKSFGWPSKPQTKVCFPFTTSNTEYSTNPFSKKYDPLKASAINILLGINRYSNFEKEFLFNEIRKVALSISDYSAKRKLFRLMRCVKRSAKVVSLSMCDNFEDKRDLRDNTVGKNEFSDLSLQNLKNHGEFEANETEESNKDGDVDDQESKKEEDKIDFKEENDLNEDENAKEESEDEASKIEDDTKNNEDIEKDADKDEHEKNGDEIKNKEEPSTVKEKDKKKKKDKDSDSSDDKKKKKKKKKKDKDSGSSDDKKKKKNKNKKKKDSSSSGFLGGIIDKKKAKKGLKKLIKDPMKKVAKALF